MILVCFLLAFVVMLSATVWNYGGNWSNFDFEYHFKTIEMMYKTGKYPLSYDGEYNVGFYPPLSHMIVKWFILAIEHPSLTVEGSLQRPWTEMFMLNSFVNALQVIPLFLFARRLAQSSIAGVSACLLIIVNGFQTWPVMGPFPDMYGLVFLSFAIYFLLEGDLGGSWAAPKYIIAGVLLVCAGFTHPLSYVFSVAFPFGVLIGRLVYRTISRHRPLLKPGDWVLSALCLVSLIVPGASYYLRADLSGFIPHLPHYSYFPDAGVFYTVPMILLSPWLLVSLAVIGYSLWRRKPGVFLVGTWLLMPFILAELHRVSPTYTMLFERYLTYGQPYFSQPQAILLGSGITFLLHEATAETDFQMIKVNRLRLPLLVLLVVGALFKTGGLVISSSAASAIASIQRLLQGAWNFPTISDMVSIVLYLGLGVSVCIAVESSCLKYIVSRLRRQARPRWNDRILG